MLRVKIINSPNGQTLLDDIVFFGTVQPTGVDGPSQPSTLRFYAQPGGFILALPQAASVDVRAFDISGRQVAVLASGRLAAGEHSLALAAGSLPNGVYFARAVVTDAGVRETRNARAVVIR